MGKVGGVYCNRSACSGCNVCQLNSEHQLLAIGTEEVRKSITHCSHKFFVTWYDQGTVECWDPRSHSRVGELNLAATGMEFSDRYKINVHLHVIHNHIIIIYSLYSSVTFLL